MSSLNINDMNIFKAISVGAFIWMLGATIYSISFFIPILEDPELQANILLAIFLIPIAWYGAGYYFKSVSNSHGIQVGLIMVITAISLDAMITVPFLIIPYGGTYQSFFSAPAFWLIVLEYLFIIALYPKLIVRFK